MPLIVLEGLDGAGKTTQTELLKERLESRGLRYEYLHFPRFDAPVYGGLIARFLRGELGGIDAVDHTSSPSFSRATGPMRPR